MRSSQRIFFALLEGTYYAVRGNSGFMAVENDIPNGDGCGSDWCNCEDITIAYRRVHAVARVHESEWNDRDSKFLQAVQRTNQYYQSRVHSILRQERFA